MASITDIPGSTVIIVGDTTFGVSSKHIITEPINAGSTVFCDAFQIIIPVNTKMLSAGYVLSLPITVSGLGTKVKPTSFITCSVVGTTNLSFSHIPTAFVTSRGNGTFSFTVGNSGCTSFPNPSTVTVQINIMT
jgi:hypothetical protein